MIELTRLRVLLIEDNVLDAKTMQRTLGAAEETEYVLDRVGSLGDALTLLGEEVFDCVLLDLSLPDSEGLVSIEAVTEHAPHTPVVVLTGLDDPATAIEAVRRGAQDYLTKQRLEPELVSRSIRYAVARNHSENELRNANEMLDIFHERERIGRDLHDTVIQQLFATGMTLQAVAAGASPEVKQAVMDAVDDIDGSIRQLREAILGLNRAPDDLALAEAILGVVETQRDALGFTATVRVGSADRIPTAIRNEVVAVVTESLANIARHAGANAAEVGVEIEGDEVVVRVIDNGRGIDPRGAGDANGPLHGRGLHNMARRAADLSGNFRLGPGPGGGTELEWRVPLD